MRKHVVLLILIFFCGFLVNLTACRETNTQLKQKTSQTDEFLRGTYSEQRIDSVKIMQMDQAIEQSDFPNIHSVLIYKDQKLVHEKYFKGEDEIWGDPQGIISHAAEDLHDVRSISKSVVSDCIGIAVQRGLIDSVGQNVFDFFPEYIQYKTGLKENLTLEHLLNMSSGLKWNEDVPYNDPENSEIQMTSSPDPIAFILSRPMEHPPGTVWNYNGGTTQLLASIIEKLSGKDVHQFAKEYLFKPLEIKDSEWTQFPGLELPAAASGLRLRSRDLLKFGMLYANGGKWEGKRVLTESWVKASTKSHIRFGRNNQVGYGYQFWILSAHTLIEGYTHEIIAAVGNGDQRIYWDPHFDLIVVTTAGNYNKW
ncbi:MAG: serine hydrolase, partial [Bacteroidota bacterium]